MYLKILKSLFFSMQAAAFNFRTIFIQMGKGVASFSPKGPCY